MRVLFHFQKFENSTFTRSENSILWHISFLTSECIKIRLLFRCIKKKKQKYYYISSLILVHEVKKNVLYVRPKIGIGKNNRGIIGDTRQKTGETLCETLENVKGNGGKSVGNCCFQGFLTPLATSFRPSDGTTHECQGIYIVFPAHSSL